MLCFFAALVLGRADILIADFEQPTYGAWEVSGTAFGPGPAQGTLPNQMTVTGYTGHGLANSYFGSDKSIGTLTSPPFTVDRKFINFLVGGGAHGWKTAISLVIAGTAVATTSGKSTTTQDTEALTWANWYVAKWQGRTAQIQIVDYETGGWGHINVDQISQSDFKKETVKPQPEPEYKETYRPQFHFTAKKNWLNDPNGLVFADGEYHLFFQHNPGGVQWGDMHWGHAVSKDLFHWKELPIALVPDQHGTNYSGSATIDLANTTGFGKDGKPPMVAMYTAAGKPFTQCLAYSNDKGRTWTKYASNPILNHIAGENRDPRIFWHAPTHEWKMALYLDGDEFAIFGSPDLKKWHELSRLHLPGSSECPELFEMPLQGSKETKWVFYAANCRYMVGTFDGKVFHPETDPRMLDFGQFYASQTYTNVPNGRRIQIGWMNGPGPYPNMPFNQQMSVPSDLTLIRNADGYTILRQPVKEIDGLRTRTIAGESKSLADMNKVLSGLKGGLYDLELNFQLIRSAPIHISIGSHDIVVQPIDKSVSFLGRSASFATATGQIKVRILVDRSSVEIFMMEGDTSLSCYYPAEDTKPKDRKIKVNFPTKELEIESFRASELKSTW